MDLISKQHFNEIQDWLLQVVSSLRSKGVLVYCKFGAEFSAAAMVLLLGHLTGEPVTKCVLHVSRLRVIANAIQWREDLSVLDTAVQRCQGVAQRDRVHLPTIQVQLPPPPGLDTSWS